MRRRIRRLDRAAPWLVGLCVAAIAITAARGQGGDLRAIDGDTLVVRSTGERVRLLGVDTPELHPCRCAAECRAGVVAKSYLQGKLDSGQVGLERRGTDRYGRTLATVRIDGRDVAPELISAGLGRVYHGERRQPWCE
jgi:endonuclease YncB( thermonuclease family)